MLRIWGTRARWFNTGERILPRLRHLLEMISRSLIARAKIIPRTSKRVLLNKGGDRSTMIEVRHGTWSYLADRSLFALTTITLWDPPGVTIIIGQWCRCTLSIHITCNSPPHTITVARAKKIHFFISHLSTLYRKVTLPGSRTTYFKHLSKLYDSTIPIYFYRLYKY